jgi:putative oxidoreductase
MRRFIPPNLDTALLILRVVLGIIMIAHGYPKVTGFSGTAEFFTSTGVPLPTLAALFSTTVEFAGGMLMILGVAADLVGFLFVIDMLGAIVFVHFKNGFSAGDGGYEFVLALLVMGLTIALAGPGKYAVARQS